MRRPFRRLLWFPWANVLACSCFDLTLPPRLRCGERELGKPMRVVTPVLPQDFAVFAGDAVTSHNFVARGPLFD
ncbi:hypothetical protein DF3PA_110032 [Candidatus Defluviicoccus seviourii]|uniref:Secreted protein n=1 Tax=Candidatus Defluviicoccus seviourii TaxID=2565273 RepID=A0A564W9Z0_9PROT|nr:hypothetical protein DF3PA_110032 [Candidatus Defluviicoccus seviourii]